MDDQDDWYSNETATFGDRVAAGREAIGLTQSDLARRLGVKLKTVRAWEEDLTEPRANKLQMLSGVLGVSLMWLLNGEGEGLEPPDEQLAPLNMDAKSVLLELRQISGELDRSADRILRLEKQLKTLLAKPND